MPEVVAHPVGCGVLEGLGLVVLARYHDLWFEAGPVSAMWHMPAYANIGQQMLVLAYGSICSHTLNMLLSASIGKHMLTYASMC